MAEEKRKGLSGEGNDCRLNAGGNNDCRLNAGGNTNGGNTSSAKNGGSKGGSQSGQNGTGAQGSKANTKETRHTISEFGRKALYDHVRNMFTIKNDSSFCGLTDDAAVALYENPLCVSAQTLFLEGVDFDLTYFPLKYLGYKAVMAALAKVAAMNAKPRQFSISVGVSQRFYVEDVDVLFQGVQVASSMYGVDLCELELKSSYTGLTVAVTAYGEAEQGTLALCSGARKNNLICLSGSLGAAYMGLKLLQREKKVFTGQTDKDAMPDLKGHEYILEHYLRPHYPSKLLDDLRQEDIVPTSMTLIDNGLATAIMKICNASGVGAKLFLDKIPVPHECYKFAEEMPEVDPLVAMVCGGEDYEILFTVSTEDYEKLNKEFNIDIIGHICEDEVGCLLVPPNSAPLNLATMGF